MANLGAKRKKRHKIVGLTYDVKPDYVLRRGDPEDANAEFDHPDTIEVIKDAIESGGHKVVKIGNVRRLLSRLKNLDVDIVFNVAEGISGRTGNPSARDTRDGGYTFRRRRWAYAGPTLDR